MLTIKEVANRLSVSERTIRNWIVQGKLKAYRFGRAYKVNDEDLTLFINNNQIKGEENNDK